MHGMITYFLRRLLLVPVTFLIITCMVYTILRLVPGGPVEQAAMMVEQQARGEGGATGATGNEPFQLDEEQMKGRQEYFMGDKPILVGYWNWLRGILRGDFSISLQTRENVLDLIVSKMEISLVFGLAGVFLHIRLPIDVTLPPMAGALGVLGTGVRLPSSTLFGSQTSIATLSLAWFACSLS